MCSGEISGWYCSGGDVDNPSICITQCGDNIKAGTESCDDGNLIDGDGCQKDCGFEPGWYCVITPVFKCSEKFGDGLVVGTEVCDDKNLEENDGCSPTSTVETFWECDDSQPSKCSPICGDGV